MCSNNAVHPQKIKLCLCLSSEGGFLDSRCPSNCPCFALNSFIFLIWILSKAFMVLPDREGCFPKAVLDHYIFFAEVLEHTFRLDLCVAGTWDQTDDTCHALVSKLGTFHNKKTFKNVFQTCGFHVCMSLTVVDEQTTAEEQGWCNFPVFGSSKNLLCSLPAQIVLVFG